MGLRFPSSVQHLLLEVQEIDTKIIRIRHSESEIVASEKNLAGSKQYLELVKAAEDWADRLEEISTRIERTDSDIDAATKRIEHDKALEANSSDSKELTALEHEIASLERRLENLMAQRFELAEEFDSVRQESESASSARDGFYSGIEAIKAKNAEAIEALNSQLTHLNVQRSELLLSIPAELAELYEKQRERYGYGASLLVGGISSASGVALTQGQLEEIQKADPDEIVICPDSGAILIRS